LDRNKQNKVRLVRAALIFIYSLLLFVIPLYAQNHQKIIELSSPVYSMLESIYLETGNAHPFRAKPWSEEELLFYLSQINREELSKAGKNVYDQILYSVKIPGRSYREGKFIFRGGLELNPEFYYHMPLDSSGGVTQLDRYYYSRPKRDEVGNILYGENNKPIIEGVPVDAEYAWNHGYEKRKPFLDIPLEFWFFDSLYMISTLCAKEEDLATYNTGNYFNFLFDEEEPYLDLYFPFRALVSLGGKNWNFQLGRDSLSWGNGLSGNLMLSDYSDYYDFIQFKAYWNRFSITNLYIGMDRFKFNGTDINYKAFLGRRIDLRPHDRVLLSLSESVTFANKQPELIRDLNFLMVFHNWMIPERSNSLMTVEISINPWKYFNIYGQIAMDEFATQYEEDRGGGGGPPIFGYMAGLSGSIPLGEGYLSLAGEWVLTSPWLYNRRAAPYYDNVRRYWSLTEDLYGNEYNSVYVTKPLGYLYGPDSIVWYGQLRYLLPGGISALTEITLITQGEKNISSTWDPQRGDVAPSGENPERKFILHLGVEYPLFSWLSFGTNLYYTSVQNRNHQEGSFNRDLEISGYLSLKIP